jgi:hypothetical protein
MNHAVGKIYYDPNNIHDAGTLIFIKASMPTREGVPGRNPVERKLPDDVWHYWKLNPTFPHQSTADQWFDELQFESYRALGEHIGRDAAREIGKALEELLG